jgi:hypothetical protein
LFPKVVGPAIALSDSGIFLEKQCLQIASGCGDSFAVLRENFS